MNLFPSEETLLALPLKSKERTTNKSQQARRLAYEKKVGRSVNWSECRRYILWSSPAKPSPPAEMALFDQRLLHLVKSDSPAGNMLLGWMAADGDSARKGNCYRFGQGGVNIPAIVSILDKLQLPHSLVRLLASRRVNTAGAMLSGDDIIHASARDKIEYFVQLNLGMFPLTAAYIHSLAPKNIAAHWDRNGFLAAFFGGDGCQAGLKRGQVGGVHQRVESRFAADFAKKFGGAVDSYGARRNETAPKVVFGTKLAAANFLVNHVYKGVTDADPVHPVKWEQFKLALPTLMGILAAPTKSPGPTSKP